MKMAKASEADLQMAMDLCTALESFERYRCFPEAMRPDPDDLAPFDADNSEHCREAMEHLLTLVRSASLMRVVYGMAVVIDPRNEVVDPDADTLEVHPKFAALEADAARYRWLRERMIAVDFDWQDSGDGRLVFAWPTDCAVSANCDETIDGAMLKTQNVLLSGG